MTKKNLPRDFRSAIGKGPGRPLIVLPAIKRDRKAEHNLRRMFPDAELVRIYSMGECSIVYTIQREDGHHLSIAHPNRYPTWEEIAKVRYEICPDDCFMALLLPSIHEYVNIHEYCMQVVEVAPRVNSSVNDGPE